MDSHGVFHQLHDLSSIPYNVWIKLLYYSQDDNVHVVNNMVDKLK